MARTPPLPLRFTRLPLALAIQRLCEPDALAATLRFCPHLQKTILILSMRITASLLFRLLRQIFQTYLVAIQR